MLTNEPKQAVLPSVRGKWNGYFIYGPTCSPQLAGKQSSFTIILEDTGGGYFCGTGRDYFTGALDSIVEGHITEQRIIFSVELETISFSAIFKGSWDTHTQQFCGSWKTAQSVADAEDLKGDWIMEFDEPLPDTYACAEQEPADNWFESEIARQDTMGNNALLTLSNIFFIIMAICALPVFLGAPAIIAVLFTISLCGCIISLLLFATGFISRTK